MDIRKFFGGKPAGSGKSALTEVRNSKGSPVQMKSPNKKHPAAVSQKRSRHLQLSSDSDSENPLPAETRKHLQKSKKPRVIQLSSSDDDLPPSASQPRPQRRGAKISPSPKETDIAESSKTSSKQNDRDDEVEISDSDEDSSFVPAPPLKKGKRTAAVLPPGQSKLEFSKNIANKAKATSKDNGKTKAIPRPQISKIDPTEFFNNFGKTNEELAKEKNREEPQQQHSKKTSPTKNQQKDLSPSRRKSPRKHHESADLDNFEAETAAGSVQSTSPDRHSHRSPTKKLDSEAIVSEIRASPRRSARNDKEKGEKASDKASKPHHTESPKSKRSSVEKELKRHHEKGDEELKDASDSVKHNDEAVKSKKSFEQQTTQSSPKGVKEVRQKKAIVQDSEDVGSVQKSESTKLSTNLVAKSAQPVAITLPWVDKYKPTSIKHLVGQNGDKSPMNKILGWLRDWPKYHLGEGAKVKRPRPPPWMAQSDWSSFKAILLSGPPGIGKTTCATLACKELGLQYIEMNASDARNKKFLESKVAELVGCHQIDEYFSTKSKPTRVAKSDELGHVLIMDEVDGMSGTEDRSGLAELIQMIKDTRIPIICICNDRQSTKMRSLVNYCFDVRFQRPRVEQIRSRMQTIAFQEKLKLTKEQIDEFIEASNHDVRQTIYNLQLLSLGSGGKSADIQPKDCAVNTFEAARRILNANTTLLEKQEMFFTDYSIMPLFVQENYPSIQNNKMSKSERLSALRKAADSISSGDIIDRAIRTTGAWSLLNEQALFSAILPSMHMNGFLKSMINFPSWLGKNSTYNKRQRLMRQLISHTHLKISADCHSMVTDYVPVFRDRLCRPLVERENDGISDVIAMYEEYDFTREDSEAIAELAVWPGMKDPGAKIQSKVKAALTRALNKEHRLLPYAVDEVSKGRRKGAVDAVGVEMELDEEGNLIEVGANDDDPNEVSDDNDEDASAQSSQSKASTKTSGRSARGGRGGNAAAKTGRGAASSGRGRGRGRGAKS